MIPDDDFSDQSYIDKMDICDDQLEPENHSTHWDVDDEQNQGRSGNSPTMLSESDTKSYADKCEGRESNTMDFSKVYSLEDDESE